MAVLITENDDVVLENNQQVTNLLAVPLAITTPLVSKDSRVAPKRQKRT